MFECCTVSTEGAVNCHVMLPCQHVTCVHAHFSMLVFPQGTHSQAHAGLYTPPNGNTLASTLDSGPSGAVRTELVESLMRARFIETLRTHGTRGYCCRGRALLLWLWAWFFEASMLASCLHL